MTAWTVVKIILLWLCWFVALLAAYDVASDVWVALGGIDVLIVCLFEAVSVGWLLIALLRLTLRECCQ